MNVTTSLSFIKEKSSNVHIPYTRINRALGNKHGKLSIGKSVASEYIPHVSATNLIRKFYNRKVYCSRFGAWHRHKLTVRKKTTQWTTLVFKTAFVELLRKEGEKTALVGAHAVSSYFICAMSCTIYAREKIKSSRSMNKAIFQYILYKWSREKYNHLRNGRHCHNLYSSRGGRNSPGTLETILGSGSSGEPRGSPSRAAAARGSHHLKKIQ